MHGLSWVMVVVVLLVLAAVPGCGASRWDRRNPEVFQRQLQEKLDSSDADLRREAVMMLAEEPAASWDTTANMLSQIALNDADEQVRAVAVGVLGSGDGGPELAEVLKQAAEDKSVVVRLECVKAVASQRTEWAKSILLGRLATDEDGSIRARAASGLSRHRDRQVLWGLWGCLDDEEFAVAYEARESLKKLTGRDLGYDRQAWQQWLSATEDPFAVLAGDY